MAEEDVNNLPMIPDHVNMLQIINANVNLDPYFGDGDDDFDDGDYDYDSDEYSIFSDAEDRLLEELQVDGDEDKHDFYSSNLQDSQYLSHLSFFDHLNIGATKLNKIKSYESLYRLLEELKLLCTLWRLRIDHPYTAHIRDDWFCPTTASENMTKEERNSRFELEINPPKRVVTNETATKRWFSQSASMYHQLFESDANFNEFFSEICKVKNHVFEVIINKFLSILPPDTMAKLPRELWEKVWRFTQNERFTTGSNVTFLDDTKYLKVGLRSPITDDALQKAEQEQINRLFDALKSLHTLVLEILYRKLNFLARPKNMISITDFMNQGAVDTKRKFRTSRAIFWHFRQMMRQRFARFSQLAHNLNVDQDLSFGQNRDSPRSSGSNPPSASKALPTSPGALEISESSPSKIDSSLDEVFPCDIPSASTDVRRLMHIQRGVFDMRVETMEKKHKSDYPPVAIVSKQICNLVVISDGSTCFNQEYSEVKLLDVTTGKVKYIVQVKCPPGGFGILLRSPVSFTPIGIYITEDRISIAFANHDGVELHSHKLEEQPETEPLRIEMTDPLHKDDFSNCDVNKSCSVLHTQERIVTLITSRRNDEYESKISVVDTDGELLLELTMENNRDVLWDIQGTRLLLGDIHDNYAIRFYSLTSGEFLAVYKKKDLELPSDQQASEPEGPFQTKESWTAQFDVSGRNEFVILSSSWSQYLLYSFDPANDMAKPNLILRGRIYEEMEISLGIETYLHFRLMNGIIYYYHTWGHCHSVGLKALLLRADHPGPTFPLGMLVHHNRQGYLVEEDKLSGTQAGYNGYAHQNITHMRPNIFMIDSDRVGFMWGWHKTQRASIARVDFSYKDEKELFDQEVASHRCAYGERRNAAVVKYLNTDEELRGKITYWNKYYGFVQAYEVGGSLHRIYLHEKNIEEPKPQIRIHKGMRLKFYLTNSTYPGQFRATRARFEVSEEDVDRLRRIMHKKRLDRQDPVKRWDKSKRAAKRKARLSKAKK